MKAQKKTIVFLLANDVTSDSRVLKISRVASNSGLNTHIVCYVSEETRDKKEERIFGINIHRVGEVFRGLYQENLIRKIFFFFPYIFLYGNPKNNKYLYLKTLELKPDIIWTNDASTLLIAAKIKKKTGAKLIYDSHEYWPEFPKIYYRNFNTFILKIYAIFYSLIIFLIEKFFIKTADIVVTVSDGLANKLKTNYHLKKKPIVLLNTASLNNSNEYFDLKSYFGLPKNCKLILHLGYLSQGRSLFEIISSLVYLPHNYYLIFVGEGELKDKLLEQAKQLNIANRLFFHPLVPYHQIPYYIGQCDVGLVLFEGKDLGTKYALPNKFFEYIQAKLPIISGPHTYEVNKIIKSEQIGIIINKIDPENIAKNTSLFIKSTNYKKTKANINILADTNYHWEMEEKKILNLLKKFI